MTKLKLDLHDIYNHGDKIEAEINRIVEEAVGRQIALVYPWQGQRPAQEARFTFSQPARNSQAVLSGREG